MTIPSNLTRYKAHNSLSDPGKHRERIGELQDELGCLMKVVRGLLVHGDWLPVYGLNPGDFAQHSRATLPTASKLDAVLTISDAALYCGRSPDRRAVGTCRDYALMLCSFLREKSVPARIRCGFARYFGTGRYEDHWVCEYWCGARQRWAFADAQLDDELSAYLSITFSADDLPPAEFLTSAIAWRAVRSGEASADHFGHGTATGDWFLRVNLARDLLAINGEEVSDWDDWRNVPQADRYLDNSAVLQCDSLAEMIQSIDTALTRHIPSRDLAPFWSVDGRR